MRKIFITVYIVFLCCTLAIAQKTISKDDFGHLVDYANCQYLMAFIEKNDTGKSYIQNTYELKVKPVLQKATLKDLNNVPTFENIKKLFPKGSNDIALKLAEKINDRKMEYENCPDNSALIKELSTTEWNNVNLVETATKIQNAVSYKFNKDSTSKKNSKDDSKILDFQKSPSFLHWIVSTAIVQIVVLCVFFLYFKKVLNSLLRQFKENVITEISENSPVNDNVQMFKDKLDSLEKRLDNIEEQVNKFSNSGKIEDKKDEAVAQDTTKIQTTIYFRTKQGKILQEELPSESGALFKVLVDKSQFEYCGGIINSDFFEGICDFENNPSDIPDKKEIKTVRPGTVKQENNSWVIDKPALIKFE